MEIQGTEEQINQVMGNSSSGNMTNICQCGHANAAGAKFCAKCGSKLG